MAADLTKLGRSLEVPNVQELAKNMINEMVPQRYVRHEHDPLIPDLSSLLKVPVIDMQKLFDNDFMDSELDMLHKASQEWGFFQLINHGVKSEVVEKMKLEIKEFFSLQVEEKKKFSQQHGDIEGYGQVFVVSEEQKLDWADMFFIFTLPTHLRKPHLIPKLPPTFRKAIEAYSSELKVLATKILNLMAKALGMKNEEMKIMFDEGVQSMRMNYYSPCPKPELVTGLCPHSDATGLTILLQVNEMDGLQIKKDGVWVPVSPLPNAFVVNIGDVMEILTNGTYQSIEHRATVNSTKERLSIATFLGAKLDGNLGPAPSLINSTTPPKFKTVSVVEYLKGLFARELKEKSYIDVLRI